MFLLSPWCRNIVREIRCVAYDSRPTLTRWCYKMCLIRVPRNFFVWNPYWSDWAKGIQTSYPGFTNFRCKECNCCFASDTNHVTHCDTYKEKIKSATSGHSSKMQKSDSQEFKNAGKKKVMVCKCPMCEREFGQRRYMYEHVRTVHSKWEHVKVRRTKIEKTDRVGVHGMGRPGFHSIFTSFSPRTSISPWTVSLRSWTVLRVEDGTTDPW